MGRLEKVLLIENGICVRKLRIPMDFVVIFKFYQHRLSQSVCLDSTLKSKIMSTCFGWFLAFFNRSNQWLTTSSLNDVQLMIKTNKRSISPTRSFFTCDRSNKKNCFERRLVLFERRLFSFEEGFVSFERRMFCLNELTFSFEKTKIQFEQFPPPPPDLSLLLMGLYI